MQRSVAIVGWSTIILSIIAILVNFFGLIDNSMQALLSTLGKAYPWLNNGMDSLMDIIQYSRIWSMYTIMYFLVILVGAIFFVRFQAIGRRILEISCWVGLANACIDSLLSYELWNSMETALAGMTRGTGVSVGRINLFGMIAIIIDFFLWVVPAIGIIVYLRRPTLKALMK